MSMQQPAYGALGQPTKTRFVDIAPGSTINVRDRRGGVDPFTAVVLEVKKEYGPTSIPALVVSVDSQDPVIVTDSGKWDVQVVTDGRILASAEHPAHLIRAKKKPVEVSTIRFEGGTASAVEIIRWAGGKAVIRWAQATQESTEALEIVTLEGVMRGEVGDWIIEGVMGEFYPCKPDVFVATYDLANASVMPQALTPQTIAQTGAQLGTSSIVDQLLAQGGQGLPRVTSIYAYLITKVDINKPEMLDISSYDHPYWPGEVILTPENMGVSPTPQRYQVDSVLGFDVTLYRIATGERASDDSPVIFDEPARVMLNLLKLGSQREAGLVELLHGVLDTAKATIEKKVERVPGSLDAVRWDYVVEILDTVEREATTVKRRV